MSAAAAVAAVLVLTGCTFGDPEATAGGDEEATFVAGTGSVPHLNPQIIVSPSVNNVAGSMLEPLVRMNDTFEIVPWLAKEWEVAGDGMSFTLHLEEDVRWHDGEPFTSDDVKFNIEEVMQFQSHGSALVESVENVETPDEHTVVVEFSEPYGPVMQVLSLQYILPKHIYGGTDIIENPANMEPVGTGAFVFESFKEGDEVTLTANPDYWKGDVEIDRMVWVTMGDTNATALALLAGEFAVGGAGQGMLDQIRADPDLETTQNGQLPRQFVMTMNADSPELADPAVRALVYQAVNREEVTSTALPEVSVMPKSMYPEQLSWIDAGVDYDERFPYDPEAIGAALDEAGYPLGEDGFRFTIRLNFMSSTSESKAVAQVLKASMAEVGINLDLVGEDVAVFTENVYQKRDFDVAIVEATLGVDPSLGITRWYECNPEKANAENPSGVCDEELQAAADAALHTADEAERAQHFQTIQDRALELMISAPIAFSVPFSVYNQAQWEGLGSNLVGNDWTEVKPKG
ncbi:MAG: ABC transporter substrate-binding protein [Pseudoclavibacter sp.]